MLKPAGPSDPWDILRTEREPPTWRIGSARPVVLRELRRYSKSGRAPAMGAPKGAVTVARRDRYPGDTLPTVRGQRPWWVLVDLWWRKPDTTVPWPGFRVDYGIRTDTVVDADWVLERAVFVPRARETQPDPGDSTSAEEHGGHAAEAVSIAMPPLALLLVGAALLYADYKGIW